MSSRVISRLSVVLGLDAQGFQREAKRTKAEVSGLEKRFGALGSSLKGVALGFAGALSVNLLVDQTRRALDYAGGLGEVAQSLSVSTKFLQEFRFAATQAGASVEGADNALGKFAVTQGKALSGNQAAVKALRDAGINMAAFATASESERFEQVADAIAKISDPTIQASRAQAIFGKGYREILPLLISGAQGFKLSAEEARKFGLVISDKDIQSADATSDKIEKLQQAISLRFSSAVAANAADIGRLADQLVRIAEIDLGTIKSIANFFNSDGKSQLRQAGNFIANEFIPTPLGRKYPGLKNPFGTGSPAPLNLFQRGAASPAAPRKGVGGAIGGGGALALSGLDFNLIPGLAQQAVFDTEAVFRRLNIVEPIKVQVNASKEELEKFKQFREQLSEDTQSIIDDLFPEEAEQADILAKLAKLDQALAEQLITPERWLEIRGRLGIELAKVKAQIDESGVLIKPGDVDVTAIDQSVLDAGRTIKTNIGDASESAAERASRAFADLALDIEGIFGGFKRGGLSGILQGVVGIAGIAARFGAFGGGEGGAAAASTAGFAGFGGARARGGPVKLGLSYLVGERGPELFTPGASGVITANDRLRGGGGGQVTKVYDLRGAMLADAFVADVERMVAAGEARAISGGAQLAMAQNKFINDRRLG